jgi:hypothetical protein
VLDSGHYAITLAVSFDCIIRLKANASFGKQFPEPVSQAFDYSGSILAMNIRRFLVFVFISLLGGIVSPIEKTAAAAENHAIWAELLDKYVKPGGVEYAGFKSEEEKLDQYLKVLENTDPKTLSPNDQFAFYINVYNAWTIKLILSAYPGVKSIKDLGTFWRSPWEKKIVRINGEVLTLDDIEHHILRPRFKDPRLHFAINCSAASCPPLKSEPYLGGKLDLQLDQATRSFINHPDSYRLEGDVLYVSRIFKWFSEDFKEGVVEFYLKYARNDLKKKLAQKKDTLQLRYLPYDWSLNDV